MTRVTCSIASSPTRSAIAWTAIQIDYVVGVGRPAEELLRIARDPRADLIVMSSHGLTGIRKLFFGSTAERVLRESDIPVLVTESADAGAGSWADLVAASQSRAGSGRSPARERAACS